MRKANLGLIGLGFIGKCHLRNSRKLSNACVIAVSDISKRALNEAKKDGIKKVFTSYEQLLSDPEIDGVIIALPTHLHVECAKRAAECGKHILLEKPIARNVPEARDVISAVSKSSVKLMIGYPLVFNPIMLKLREQVRSGALGDIVTAYATNVNPGPFQHRVMENAPVPVPEWWFNKEMTGGGVLIDLGSHMINLLQWLFGEIVHIQSHLGYRFNLDFEDHAICLARFRSGTTAIVNVGWFSQKYQCKVEVLGSVEHSIANNVPPNMIVAAVQMLSMNTTVFWRPFINELAHFANCIIQDKEPSPSGYDGLRDLEVIESAYQNSTKLEW